MESLPTPLFIKRGTIAGYDPEVLARAGKARDAAAAAGAVPVLTLNDLAGKVDASYGYLRKIVQRTLDPYESITRMKRDGGTRTISSPQPLLLQIQRWMLHNMLAGISQHDRSYAYRAGRSIVDCAQIHVGSSWLVKMDLHNFFGEIHEQRAYRVFRSVGYPSLLSFEAARLCTRVPHGPDSEWKDGRGVDGYGLFAPGVLPQGAPTSGALANAIATPLDGKLNELAKELGFQYTRYSDDLTFSSVRQFDRKSAMSFVSAASRAIFAAGFKVHHGKTRIIPPGSRKVVLGLLLGDDAVRLMPEFRRQLSNHVRGVNGWGLVRHAAHRGFDSALSFVNYVDGCIAFGKGVDREWSLALEAAWIAALRKDGLLG